MLPDLPTKAKGRIFNPLTPRKDLFSLLPWQQRLATPSVSIAPNTVYLPFILGFPIQSLRPHCLLQRPWFSQCATGTAIPSARMHLNILTLLCLQQRGRGCTQEQPTPKLLLPDNLLHLNGCPQTDSSRTPQATRNWDKISLPNGHLPSEKPSGGVQKNRSAPFFETCSPRLSLLLHLALFMLLFFPPK